LSSCLKSSPKLRHWSVVVPLSNIFSLLSVIIILPSTADSVIWPLLSYLINLDSKVSVAVTLLEWVNITLLFCGYYTNPDPAGVIKVSCL
jgi:hypothetical protein